MYQYTIVPLTISKNRIVRNQHAKSDAQTPGYYQKMVGNDLVEVKSRKCFGNA